jgi:hypothetical protein
MVNNSLLPEEEILVGLCQKYNIKKNLIEELLQIEKGYQDYERRKGIFQQISELIKSEMAE